MKVVREGLLEEVIVDLSFEWLVEVIQVNICMWREGGYNIGKEEGIASQGTELHNIGLAKSSCRIWVKLLANTITWWWPPKPRYLEWLKHKGNGTPLQYSCLENPKDGGAWWAAVHWVAKNRTRLCNFTFTFHCRTLEKEMATHSSVLALRIPGTGEPGGRPSMGSHRVGHDWSDLAAAAKHKGGDS